MARSHSREAHCDLPGKGISLLLSLLPFSGNTAVVPYREKN
jgi:hypothetical protein